MSDISRYTGRFRARQAIQKRPRESLVCEQCRKSKLRCDRNQPCSSCVKRDVAASCSYQRPAGSTSESSGRISVEDRLMHLESLIKDLMQNKPPDEPEDISSCARLTGDPNFGNGPTEPLYPPETEREDEALYAGFTHWSAVLDDIDELKAAASGIADSDERNRSINLIASNPSSEVIFGSAKQYCLQQILNYGLPPKVEVDRFLSLYFQGETFILPFIHVHQFQRECRDFWADPSNVNPLWLSLLFSICYIGSLVRSATDPEKNDSGNGNATFHIAAGQCLVLGGYSRPQKFAVDALVLYAHCKNLRGLDPSREAGQVLGVAVRMAYEMGFHRDPDFFGTFSPFEGEMRRRLWALCKQMDVMTSFMLGLPSNIYFENCDTRPPRNLMDSDFDVDTQVLPESRSEDESTRLLWFIVKNRLLDSFSKVCRYALSFQEKSDAEILELDAEIRRVHGTIPVPLRMKPIAECLGDAPFIILTRMYVEFITLKSLCILHRKHMAQGKNFSTKACIEAGKSLVEHFIAVHGECGPGGQLRSERWMLSNFTVNDFLLGTMTLCFALYYFRKTETPCDITGVATESELLTLLHQSYNICLEKSQASRDTRRVAGAIRLLLKDTRFQTENTSVDFDSTAPLPTPFARQHFLPAEMQGPVSASVSTQSHNSWATDSPFGPLDPFDFVGNDININIDNIDWASFDQHMTDTG